MKVKIGGVGRQVSSPADLRKVESDIADAIMRGAITEAVEVTPAFLRRLKERVSVAATFEANRIMDLLVRVIDRPRRRLSDQGVTAKELMVGMDLSAMTRRGLMATGGVSWKELSLPYSRRKDKKFPGNRDNMFKYRGSMRNYFKGQGATIIRNRLGGIQVDVDETFKNSYVSQGNYKMVRREVVDDAKIVLGRVTVTMFPRLSPSLAPMLATRRWTDSGNGAMERAIFGGTRTLDKLLNRHDAYRPLVTPVVQFFMLNRIPAAINATVRDYLRRTNISIGSNTDAPL